MLKRDRGAFSADHFVCFADDEGRMQCNNFVAEHGSREEDKVPVKVVASADKPGPTLPFEQVIFEIFNCATQISHVQ